jgi:D-sedoheptulose 7-phosphate isomerase
MAQVRPMTPVQSRFAQAAVSYLERLQGCFNQPILRQVEQLAEQLMEIWVSGRQVLICGNGGSAANAMHIANDFHYGIGACGPGPRLPGLRVEALPANAGVITCLANDTGYDNIYAHQIEVKSRPDDLLIVLSGSGNSPNVVRALEAAKRLKMKSFAVVAFSGGRCLELADVAIHFPVDDMQIAEDTQLVVGHMCMQWLNTHKPDSLES